MTEQEWLEAKRKGEALRTRIESNICNVLVKSGVMADCLAYIQAAEQSVHPTVATVAPQEVVLDARNSG